MDEDHVAGFDYYIFAAECRLDLDDRDCISGLESKVLTPLACSANAPEATSIAISAAARGHRRST